MAFHALETLSRMYDGYQKAFRIEGRNLLLVQIEGQVYLIENRCPHMDAPLTDAAQVPGGLIRCRVHGIEFNLLSGKPCGPLANTLECLNKFSIVYEGNQLGVDI